MAIWPAGLPAPQKKITLTPGDTRLERKLQSGRTEFRRFGDGKPDQMKVLFRLLWTQWDTFKEFYERDLNSSLNWFSASWLTTLGYSDHKAKILGYPREVARQGYYVDIVCTLMVQKMVWIVGEDTEWPCETTGEEPPPPPTGKGYVYNGAYTSHCDEYDSALDTWASKADVPGYSFLFDLAASTIGDSGYIYGGRYTAAYRYCRQYTPDTWTTKTNMPIPARQGLAASTISISGYIYGGYGSGYFQDCDEYTPDVWVSKSNIPSPARQNLAASTIGGSGYIYGGRPSTSVGCTDCDQYTPDTWTSKTSIPSPSRWSLAASTIGDSGYIYGGQSGLSKYQDCDEYTPDVWVSKSNIPSPARDGLAASTIGDSGYIYGGYDGASTQDCDEYTPDTWSVKSNMLSPARHDLAASTI